MERNNQATKLLTGLCFIGPNLLGFAAFTFLPLLISVALAFSNWDIRFHNMFTDKPLEFVGLANFSQLLSHPDFWRYFGNTLFLMLGIPFSVAGSLGAALLLNSRFARPRGMLLPLCVGGGGLLVTCSLLALFGSNTGVGLLVAGLLVVVATGGIAAGSTFYRTIFYIPHFTAGAATFILWKKLYDPGFGPVNRVLTPILDWLSPLLAALPPAVFSVGRYACFTAAAYLAWLGCAAVRRRWSDGEAGGVVYIAIAHLFAFVPALWLLILGGGASAYATIAYAAIAAVIVAANAFMFRGGRDFTCESGRGSGTVLAIGVGAAAAQFVLLGAAAVLGRIPDAAAVGINPPEWLVDYHWAKPAIMIMGIWGAIGSNNMLLYLAGLSNVPVELNEAADIDGASGFQKFWHITWPQLAPITFFILVMSVIGGLQGGFEMARAMTGGGPAGATTTISYFIYNEGFNTGRLGYASAIAWTLFAMVFSVTIFNWKFGNKYVNE